MPPIMAIAGAPRSSRRLIIRAASAAASSRMATASGSRSSAWVKTRGAKLPKSPGVAVPAQITIFCGSRSNTDRMSSASGVIGAMPSSAQIERRSAVRPIAMPLPSSAMSAPQPPTLVRRPSTTAKPAAPVPRIRMAPSRPPKAPSQEA